jgi:hypothetical protein
VHPMNLTKAIQWQESMNELGGFLYHYLYERSSQMFWLLGLKRLFCHGGVSKHTWVPNSNWKGVVGEDWHHICMKIYQCNTSWKCKFYLFSLFFFVLLCSQEWSQCTFSFLSCFQLFFTYWSPWRSQVLGTIRL